MKLRLLIATLAIIVLVGCVKDSFKLQKLKGEPTTLQ